MARRATRRGVAVPVAAALKKEQSQEPVVTTKANKLELQRRVKVVTDQKTIDKPSPVEEFPMREWAIKVFLLDEEGNERPADVFTKVVYNLHPTFENPTQSTYRPQTADHRPQTVNIHLDAMTLADAKR